MIRLVDYSHDLFAVPYVDMHPILQRYFNRLGECRRLSYRDPRHTLGRLIRHAQRGDAPFIRDFLSGAREASGPINMCVQCSEVNIDRNELTEDIIEYCSIKISENDIEFYARGRSSAV